MYGLFNMGNASKIYSIGKRLKMKKMKNLFFIYFFLGPRIIDWPTLTCLCPTIYYGTQCYFNTIGEKAW